MELWSSICIVILGALWYDNVAEWSKAHVSGTCLNWRGFESLHCHLLLGLRIIFLLSASQLIDFVSEDVIFPRLACLLISQVVNSKETWKNCSDSTTHSYSYSYDRRKLDNSRTNFVKNFLLFLQIEFQTCFLFCSLLIGSRKISC